MTRRNLIHIAAEVNRFERAHVPLTTGDLAVVLGVGTRQAHTYLVRLVRAGWVTQVNPECWKCKRWGVVRIE